ncbi:hypothetical protein [Streptomyces xylophagus]|uniref:hypothetical protein n=1 Tax=Streptomyces xylophagus TaxID=285514 RepID=UPI000AA1CDD4|nr:hypothetical protein [Streptomyces xylophagus]
MAVRKVAARLDSRIVFAAGVVLPMIGTVPFALADAHGGARRPAHPRLLRSAGAEHRARARRGRGPGPVDGRPHLNTPVASAP